MATIQAILIGCGVVIATLFFGTSALLLAPFNPSGRLVHWFARWWGRTLLRIGGVPVYVHGLAHIPRARPCVLVSNHASAADIPIFLGHLPLQFRFIAKDSLFRIPILGWCMRLAGYIGVDRGSPTRAMRSLKRAATRLKTGFPVLVFPEGTRSRTGEIQPFNNGAFLIAIEAGVPVVPMAITGSYDIVVRGSFRVRHGVRVDVVVGPPIEAKAYTAKQRARLAEETHAAVMRCFEEGCKYTGHPAEKHLTE